MPRKPRHYLPGFPAHTVQRGNDRQACFYTDDDYDFYLDALGCAAAKSGCDVHAYCLMTNHVHLLITPLGVAPFPWTVWRLGFKQPVDNYFHSLAVIADRGMSDDGVGCTSLR